MHVVAVLALDGVVGFDLAVPCQVFGSVVLPDGGRPYEVRVCSADTEPAATAYGREYFHIRAPWRLADAATADTIIVPGIERLDEPAAPEVLDLLRDAAARGARVASICTGAFVLGAAGLLDGSRVTTHWRYAAGLARAHPDVEVDPDVLFVDAGAVLTSAGVAAGLDLCLHMVRRDHGAAVAANTARQVVMPPQRTGGQAQFIVYEDPDGGSLTETLQWMRENLHDPLTLTDIARQASTSTRSLSRRFREQTGTTPLQWLLRQRVMRAQQLLETTDLPIEEIAVRAGLGTAASLRRHFARQLNAAPLAYRRTFRTGVT